MTPPNGRHRRGMGRGIRRHVRTVPLMQMEATECGAASLGIVLAHHGRYVPLEEIRVASGVSRDGSKASIILRAARKYGLDAAGMQMDIEALAEVDPPAILFWKFDHFLVWEGFGRRLGKPVAFVNDPASGRYTVPMEEFDTAFTGVVLTLRPGRDFRRGGRPPGIAGDLRTRLRGTAGAVLMGLVASLMLAVVGFVTPLLTVATVNAILRGDGVASVLPILAAMAVVVALTVGLSVQQQGYLLRMQVVSTALSQARFLRHLLRIPVGFFTQRGPAEITKRLESNSDVSLIITKDVLAVLLNSMVVVGYAVLMWTYDRGLALVGVTMALLNTLILRIMIRMRQSAVAKMRADRAKFIEVSFDGLHLIETMKATGAEHGFFQRWAGRQATTVNSQQRLFAPSAVLVTMAPMLATFASALVLLIGGIQAIDGAISIGALVAFQTLLAGFARPVGELSGVAARMQDLRADVARLKDVENFPDDEVFSRPEPEHPHILAGRLEFNGVTFGYSPLDKPLLRDLSFSVGPGQQIALVGGSGSGKSTVVRLISGLYRPWQGEILLDGQPHDSVPRSVLAASVAFVDQEICLFEGTVRDNVALWDPSISDAAVIAALKDAEVYDVVARHPEGIHSPVEEHGRNFSGGQRQRLEIARALARSPSLLILDEATSALDADTEQTIEDNLRRRGCACVVIAHRLSTVRDSDEILVLEQGEVVERGRHEDLVRASGPYADLVNEPVR